jgi:hypothetical protein
VNAKRHRRQTLQGSNAREQVNKAYPARCALTGTPGGVHLIPANDCTSVSGVADQIPCHDARDAIRPDKRLIQEPRVITQFNRDEWAKRLQFHHDQLFANELLSYIDNGVPLLYDGPLLQHVYPNWKSLHINPDEVEKCINHDLEKKWKVGPFDSPPFTNFVGSPMGAVIKPSKTRIIHDLSWPPGLAVNTFIPGDACSVKYVTVDDAVQLVKTRGRGALMAKLDLKDAYKQVGVRPKDWPLVGSTLVNEYGETKYFFDSTLILESVTSTSNPC